MQTACVRTSTSCGNNRPDILKCKTALRPTPKFAMGFSDYCGFWFMWRRFTLSVFKSAVLRHQTFRSCKCDRSVWFAVHKLARAHATERERERERERECRALWLTAHFKWTELQSLLNWKLDSFGPCFLAYDQWRLMFCPFKMYSLSLCPKFSLSLSGGERDWLITLYFSTTEILAHRATDISAVPKYYYRYRN